MIMMVVMMMMMMMMMMPFNFIIIININFCHHHYITSYISNVSIVTLYKVICTIPICESLASSTIWYIDYHLNRHHWILSESSPLNIICWMIHHYHYYNVKVLSSIMLDDDYECRYDDVIWWCMCAHRILSEGWCINNIVEFAIILTFIIIIIIIIIS